jgi:hypothetical protein
MMQHHFQLSTPLAFADVARIIDTLGALPGVHSIDAAPGARELSVHADELAISREAILDAAARAGFAEVQQAARNGGCCGGCCS